MRRNMIVVLIILIILFSCDGRSNKSEFTYNDVGTYDFGDRDIEVYDSNGNDIVLCEDYRCYKEKHIINSVYFNKEDGSFYVYEYNRYNETDKKKRVVKYNKSEFGYYYAIWERELEDSEELPEDMYVIYIDKDENNLYLSLCDANGSHCNHALGIVRYEKYENRYRKAFYYYKNLIGDQDYINSLAVDSYGNTYVSGEFVGQVDFGNGQVVKNSEECIHTGSPYDPLCSTDGFLIKIDREGKPIWSRTFPGIGDNSVGDISIYGDDLYVSLISDYETYEDGKEVLFHNGEAKVVKIGIDGEIKWSRSLSGKIIRNLSGPRLDNDGNIYISGMFDLHSSYPNAEKYKDLIIAKFNKNGEFVWGKKFESNRMKSGNIKTVLEYLFIGIDYIDKESNIYTTGIFKIQDVYPSRHGYTYYYNFLSKYNKNGERVGYREFDSDGWTYVFNGIKYINPDKNLLYLVVEFSPEGYEYIDNCILYGSDKYGRYDKYLLEFNFEVCE